jgi:4-hydroxy-tetrahydrodipicolinate reductase
MMGRGGYMHIAIVGFGKMGHVVYQSAIRDGHTIAAVIDPYSDAPEVTDKKCDVASLANADVVIEFSVAEGIEERFRTYAEARIPTVIATTGWYDRLPEIEKEFSKKDCSIIWSGNFAIGVHLFFSIVRHAAKLMDSFSTYDPVVQELFHSGKGDSPSGTSLMIGKILLEELQRKDSVESARLDRKRKDSEIHLSSARGGSNPGTHTVIFDSPVDSVEITHRARSREGFAAGAIQAAAWVSDGRKGFFSLDDMLAELTG